MLARQSKWVGFPVVVITLVSVLAAPISAQSFVEGRLAGQLAGEEHPTGAGAWSFAWGFLFGLIGAGGSVAYYTAQSPQPGDMAHFELQNRDSEYRLAYMTAYRDTARGKMIRQSAIGGVAGWLTGVTVTAAMLVSTYSAADAHVSTEFISVTW